MNATEIKSKPTVLSRARRRSQQSNATATPVDVVASRKSSTGVRTKPQAKVLALSAEERRRWIEERAYAMAEARGFHGGSALGDWLRAEAEVDAALKMGRAQTHG
jgi:Protein of unknown function (DUF2934)